MIQMLMTSNAVTNTQTVVEAEILLLADGESHINCSTSTSLSTLDDLSCNAHETY